MLILITRPKYEIATVFCHSWTSLIIEDAKNRGIKIIDDLEKRKASRKNIESYLKKQDPSIVMFNGHGNSATIFGHDNEPLIEAFKNSALLKGKDIYVRACDSGKVLGPDAIKAGANSFIGYKELFRMWTQEDDFLRNPLKDPLAKPFFDSSNQVMFSLIKGKEAKDANEDSIKVYRKLISQLLTSQSENFFILSDLYWNMQNQICLENSNK